MTLRRNLMFGLLIFFGFELLKILLLDINWNNSFKHRKIISNVKAPAPDGEVTLDGKLSFISARRILPSRDLLKSGYPIICLTICEPNKDDLKGVRKDKVENQPSRQFNQTVNLIKSAVSLTKLEHINFVVLIDQYWIYEELLESIRSWPKHIKVKVVLQRRGIWYPENRKYFRALFRVCATERIFLPYLLSDIDSVIYLDTDVLFMRPPEELWHQFSFFNSHQLAGISPCLYNYNKNFKYPHYGESGLNVGLWMMNLTRMRNFPGGWDTECFKYFDIYGSKLTLYDQDLTNIVFSKHPEMVYDVGCHWNYRYKLCSKGSQLCDSVADHGVHLLHGCSLTFFSDKELKFKKFYEAWDKFEAGRPLRELLISIKNSLAEVDEQNLKSKCKNIDNIDAIFTKGLENFIISNEL